MQLYKVMEFACMAVPFLNFNLLENIEHSTKQSWDDKNIHFSQFFYEWIKCKYNENIGKSPFK